jgi:hypothetical protein
MFSVHLPNLSPIALPAILHDTLRKPNQWLLYCADAHLGSEFIQLWKVVEDLDKHLESISEASGRVLDDIQKDMDRLQGELNTVTKAILTGPNTAFAKGTAPMPLLSE